MMKIQIVGIVFAASIAGGIGAGVIANAVTSSHPALAKGDKPTASATTTVPRPSAAGPTSAVPTQAENFVIAPGIIGPVKAGMTKKEAAATGLFDVDVAAPADGCPMRPLEWKKEYANTFDILTAGNGEVMSIGVRAKGPTTEAGIGVGSTLADVKAAVADATPVEAGYGQTGVYDFDPQTGRWLGYLFDPAVGDIQNGDKVTFIEVTKSGQPGLMRDGC